MGNQFINSIPLFLLPLYGMMSLVSMGVMNTGFAWVALFFAYLTFTQKKISDTSHSGIQEFKYFSSILVLVCLISTIAALYFPFSYAGHVPTIDLHSPLKLWYLVIPGVLLSIFSRLTENIQMKTFQYFLKAWWASTIVFAVIAIIQFKTGWP